MKNIKFFLMLSFCLVQLVPLSARAQSNWNFVVTYVEVNFGCNGLSPDVGVSPAINLGAGAKGEMRIGGSDANRFVLQGNQMVFNAPDGRQVIVGNLASNWRNGACIDEGTEGVTSSWNPVTLGNVFLHLTYDGQFTISITDLSTNREYDVSWPGLL